MASVSIIMAAFNAEKSIKKAIESIINQSYKDWEFIICDDCSTDNTFSIMQEYSRLDSRITILRNDSNMFAAYSRNRCLELASGKYVVIQDSDDYSHPNRISKTVDYLEQNKDASFVSTSAYFINENGVWGERNLSDGRKIPEELVNKLCFIHAATTFRRECFVSTKGYYVENFTQRGQDYYLFMMLYSLGYFGDTISEKLYYISETENSYKRRKFIYRVHESKIRFIGFKAMKVKTRYFIYVLKPLIVGLVPHNIMLKMRQFMNK